MKIHKMCKSIRFVTLLLCGGVCGAVAQSAKDLHDQGMTAADQCPGLKQVCKAASMDKKYKKDCDDFALSMNLSSNRNLNTGYEKLEAKLYPSAARYANNVCDYDPALSSKKQQLLEAIKNAQAPVVAQVPAPVPPAAREDVSPAKFAEADHDFANGDFEAAAAAAHQVTDKDLQPSANAILDKISRYTAAIQDGRQKEAADPQGALQSYRSAISISTRGTGDPSGRIAALETRLHPPAFPMPANPTNVVIPNKVPSLPGQRPPAPDPGLEAARVIAEARQAESHNLQEAMKLFQAAQHLQPTNPEAVAGLKRVQEAINSRPEEQAKVLGDAIRAFYGSNYSDAEDGLTSYLSSATAKYRGAAYFYLGATRLYREILETYGHKAQEAGSSPQVQRSFKDARNACYRPVGKYLSPIVLSAWNVSSANVACAR